MKKDESFLEGFNRTFEETFIRGSVVDKRTEEEKREDTINAYKGGIAVLVFMFVLAGLVILLGILNPEMAGKAGNWSLFQMAEDAKEREEERLKIEEQQRDEEFKQRLKAILEEDPDYLKKIDINIDNIENVENFNVENN